MFFFYQKYNAVFRVMTVLVSDVQLIRIRWYHPSLLFSQSHKFENDWDFDFTLFWCFHNHTSLKITEILISLILSHRTINQKEHFLSFVKAVWTNRNIDATEHNAAFIHIQVDWMAVLWKEETDTKQLSIGNANLASPIS